MAQDANGCEPRTLHAPPEGPGGWLVVEAEGSVRAVPFRQVAWINLQ